MPDLKLTIIIFIINKTLIYKKTKNECINFFLIHLFKDMPIILTR